MKQIFPDDFRDPENRYREAEMTATGLVAVPYGLLCQLPDFR